MTNSIANTLYSQLDRFGRIVCTFPTVGLKTASVLGVFEPITAILVGTLVFGEALTTNIVLGIVIAIAAVTFMIVSTKR